MSDDYRVKSRLNSEVRHLAKKARSFFGVADARRVDVVLCLKRPTIWTLRGEKRLNFQVRPDAEMGLDDASTSYGNGVVTVSVKQSVGDKAIVGDGRARQTHSHELGHAVMHDGVKMARRALGNKTPNWIRPFESAEHQAKVFAPAFLINDAIAQDLSSADDISIEFGISLESAKIYFDEMTVERDRQKNAQRMLRIAAEFRASTASGSQKIPYIDEICTNCGNKTLIPMGIKFMCHSCNYVSDRFQDGDITDFF